MKKASLFKPGHGRSSNKTFNPRKHIDALYSTKEWRTYRLVFLKINSRCYACAEEATVVDHLDSHKGNIDLFWKVDNFAPLCSKCHNTVTALFDRMKNYGSYKQKVEWLTWQRAKNQINHRIKIVPLGEEIQKYIDLKRSESK